MVEVKAPPVKCWWGTKFHEEKEEKSPPEEGEIWEKGQAKTTPAKRKAFETLSKRDEGEGNDRGKKKGTGKALTVNF